MTRYIPKSVLAMHVLALGFPTVNLQPAAAASTKAVADDSPNSRAFAQFLRINQRIQVDNSTGSISPPQSAADESTCSAERDACIGDHDCYLCLTQNNTCDDTAIFTCSEMMNYYCCAHGESCSNNALLVAYIGCLHDEDGCNIELDLCDSMDDDGALLSLREGRRIQAADETCADYTGGCTQSLQGPALDDVVCTGACDESTCCVWNEFCSRFEESDCADGLIFDDRGGSCSGACVMTAEPCCLVPACGNSFDYDPSNACPTSNGPALASTLCSTGTNGCDWNLCCAAHESCSAFDSSVCDHPLNLDMDDFCEGACDATEYVDKLHCCSKNACVTDFHPGDCTIQAHYDDTVVCDGSCDEATCCPVPDETCADFGDDCGASATSAANTVQCTGACTGETCCLPNETCADYTGGCTEPSEGPALDDMICSGPCDESTCCVPNGDCVSFPDSDCPTDTTYDSGGGECNGVCDATEDNCCPASTCDNTFDYYNADLCADDEDVRSTLCSSGTNGCNAGLCCLPNETCDDYTDGCTKTWEGPAPDDVVCTGPCDESTCCVSNENCYNFDESDCPAGTIYNYYGGNCNGVCDATGDNCCPASTCDNTFDYYDADRCAYDDDIRSTLCSSGTNGCDADLCCLPNETCVDYSGGCTYSWEGPALDDVVCTGPCDESTCCVWDEWCDENLAESDCPANTIYDEWGQCNGACKAADTACCPASTCDNTFDYYSVDRCAYDVDTQSTLCSTGTNGCNANLCCLPNETCADYTGGCTYYWEGPALDDVVCTGACDESTCCVYNEWCDNFPESDCPADTTYSEWEHCNGACKAADTACCPASTCGNSFDYSDRVNGCASSEGPALNSTLCSTSANGCDHTLCCVPNESCSAFSATDCEHPLWLNEDADCDGVCDWDDVYPCCTREACVTHFNPRDCTTEAFYDDTAVCDCDIEIQSLHGYSFPNVVCICDEDTCCPAQDEFEGSEDSAEADSSSEEGNSSEDSSSEDSSSEDSSSEDSSEEDSWTPDSDDFGGAISSVARSSFFIAFGSAAAGVLAGILC